MAETDTFDINKYIQNEIDEILGKKDDKKIDTLVLSGGSLKGISQMGALYYMEKHGILKLSEIETFAGTSAGGILSVLFSIGYKPMELFHFFMNIDIKKTCKVSAHNLFSKLGLDDGKRMMIVIKELLKAKNTNSRITFGELHNMTGKTVIITGACINDKKSYYFSHLTDPDMRVIDALRITASIPIYFTPRKYNGKIFIDGGCIDDYPIAQFKEKLDNVIGIYVSDERKNVKNISTAESFLINTFECICEGRDKSAVTGFEQVTISIKCKSGETKGDMSAMFDCGYRTAKKFYRAI